MGLTKVACPGQIFAARTTAPKGGDERFWVGGVCERPARRPLWSCCTSRFLWSNFLSITSRTFFFLITRKLQIGASRTHLVRSLLCSLYHSCICVFALSCVLIAFLLSRVLFPVCYKKNWFTGMVPFLVPVAPKWTILGCCCGCCASVRAFALSLPKLVKFVVARWFHAHDIGLRPKSTAPSISLFPISLSRSHIIPHEAGSPTVAPPPCFGLGCVHMAESFALFRRRCPLLPAYFFVSQVSTTPKKIYAHETAKMPVSAPVLMIAHFFLELVTTP